MNVRGLKLRRADAVELARASALPAASQLLLHARVSKRNGAFARGLAAFRRLPQDRPKNGEFHGEFRGRPVVLIRRNSLFQSPDPTISALLPL
jgi:hypothetical protein